MVKQILVFLKNIWSREIEWSKFNDKKNILVLNKYFKKNYQSNNLKNSFKILLLNNPASRIISFFKREILSLDGSSTLTKETINNTFDKPFEKIKPSDLINLINRNKNNQIKKIFLPQWRYIIFSKYDSIINNDFLLDKIQISETSLKIRKPKY